MTASVSLSAALEDVFYIYAVFIFLLNQNNEAWLQRWWGGVELLVLPPDKHHFLLVLCDSGSVMMEPEKLCKNKVAKKIFQFLLWCHPTMIMSVGVWGGSVQWPKPEVQHYKFSLKASRAHVVPTPPPKHFTVAREEPEQQSWSSCQEGNEPELFVRSRLGLLSTTDSYPPHLPPPHPLPSDRLETATFSAPAGNGEFVLPPTKIYIFWASLPFIDVNFNLRYDKECASWIEGAVFKLSRFRMLEAVTATGAGPSAGGKPRHKWSFGGILMELSVFFSFFWNTW